MSLSQRAGTPGRRTQRAPARRANRHAAIPLAAQRHSLGAGLTPAKPNRGKALEGPPADQRALRISTAPSTHLFRLNRRHVLHHTPPARQPARRHILRRPAALLRSRTDTRQTEPWESVGRPPADQRALRISNAPSTHLFRLNRRHALHHTPPAHRHTPRRPAALLRSRTDTRQTEPRKSVGRPPADQRALRISTAPSTHLFRLNRRHALHHTPPARRPFRAHHRQAPFLSASPISFQGDTALHVKPSPDKSTFRPLFAPSAPQPPRSGRRPPFSQTVDRRSDAAVCQSGAFTKTTAVYLHGKKINYLFRPGTFTGGSASGTRRRPVWKRCKPASRGQGRPAVQPQLILRR